MSDFAVFANKSTTAENYPFLLDVQSELLSALETRLVIPLVRKSDIGKAIIKNLNPIARIDDTDYVVMTQQMAAVPRTIIGAKVEESEISRPDVLTAIDFLITGI